jgi:hypothetical protein
MKTFKTLDQALKAVDNQLTIQDLLNNRIYLKGKGWTNVKLTDELKEQIIDKVTEILGGWHSTRSTVRKSLQYREPQHWTLRRMFVNNYGNGAKISYCAGQCYTTELAEGRKYIKNLY